MAEDKIEHDLESLIERQKVAAGKDTRNVGERLAWLQRMKNMLVEHEKECLEALYADLRKPAFEAYATEMAVLLNEIDHVIRHLPKWTKERRTSRLKLDYRASLRKSRSPYGSVLIISPWNYPLQLALMPAISAIAAGNRCVIKPSEHAPETASLLQDIIGKSFSPEEMAVVTGGTELSKKLTTLDFDLIFFTGGPKAGREVSKQAAGRLTPVILELGGKNPCIIDETASLKEAVPEIVWGKFLNAGQTCIAPDTLYVHASIYEESLQHLKAFVTEFYGEDPSESPDYGRIGHQPHYKTLLRLMQEGKLYCGGSSLDDELYIEPTVLTDIQPGSHLFQEEIFGPILPVIPYTDLESLLAQGDIQKDSLAAYIFSESDEHIRLLRNYSKSTILSVNQVVRYAADPVIPFGGIGSSGQGAYHGYSGYLALSYERTESRPHQYLSLKQKFPPYSPKDVSLLKKLRKWLL